MKFDMETIKQFLLSAILPFAIFVVTLFAGYLIRKIIFSRLQKWSKGTKTQIDDIIIAAIRGPFIVWFLMLGTYFALSSSALPEEATHILNKILLVLGIGSVTMVLANVSSKLIKIYSSRIESALPVTSLTQHITRIVFFGIGILIILNSLGISIAPILATLGVGGLAVALALQDTLGSLFSGFHIIASKQIRVGDYVKLESGEEGYVTDINWRTTQIKMLANNTVLVPNTKLSQSIVTNYYIPGKDLAVLVNLGVHYGSDLAHVEKVTCAVGKEVMGEVTGGVANFDPFIRYHTFADSSVNFTVILRGGEFVDQYLIKHEFIKRLHERYKKENIVIPFPIRAINTAQEQSIVEAVKK